MSVESVGVRGYEYQYLVSAYIAIYLLDQENVNIYIEPTDGEDSRIVFESEGECYILDVQVKNRSSQIDLEEFSSWISHFDKHSRDIHLLKKLKQENNRFVLFVTNARCRDDVSLFVDSNNVYLPLTVGMSDELLDRIKINTLAHYNNATSLGKERHNSLEHFFKDTSTNQTRAILKKNRVWESMDGDTVHERLTRLLNKKYAVPQSQIDDVIRKLDELVRQGRDSKKSIADDIVRLLSTYRGDRIFTYDDKLVPRVETSYCNEILETSHVLLLTGVSLCGKTYLAKELAQRYQESGFKVKITSDLDGDSGAFAFLRHVSSEERLLVLEDPLGSITASTQSAELVAKLERLLDVCSPHRKLIVTMRSDILLHAFRCDSTAECRIKIHMWQDLTSNDATFGEKIWMCYYGKSSSSVTLFHRLRGWLERNEHASFLQPGQIVYLYHSQPDLSVLEQWKDSEIVHEARIDSSRLAQLIENQGQKSIFVFMALGLSCNTYRAIKITDLGYLLSESKEEPGLNPHRNEHRIRSYNLFGGPTEIPPFPTCDEIYTIKDEYMTVIRRLRDSGYIKVDQVHSAIVFTHPIYNHASKIVFQTSLKDVFADKERIFRLLSRSLASPSKEGALCAITVAELYYEEEQNTILKQRVKELLLRSLHSLFPSVKDRVIMYFDSRLNELSDQEQEAFVNSVKVQSSINSDDILWYEGEPYYNTAINRGSGFGWLNWNEDGHNLRLKKLEARERLTAEEIWNMLAYNAMTDLESEKLLHVINLALNHDESFIRARAIKILFQYFAYTFEDISNYLEPHEHPDYIYNLFHGALSSWSKYSLKMKAEILQYFLNSLSIISVAIRSKHFFENFEDSHARDGLAWDKLAKEEIRELWIVWYDVFITLLNHFPSQHMEMNEAHMVNVARKSLAYFDDLEKIVQLASSWYHWLQQYRQHHLPDDYGMNVADYLLEGTGRAAEVRVKLFQELLEDRQTSLLTVTIGAMVDHWSFLSKNEQNKLMRVLQSERADTSWLQGVALNRHSVPDEIQISIVGEVLFTQEINVIVDRLWEKGLLEYCLNVYCGYPQPLWWNGYHHNNSRIWNRVIIEVLERSFEGRVFDIALREFIDSLYNHDTRRFPDGINIYIRLITDPAKRHTLFCELLKVTATQNQNNKQMWDLLFAYSSESEKQMFFKIIAENIEAVQYCRDSEDDLFELFDSKVISGKLYPEMDIDSLIIKKCSIMKYFNQKATPLLDHEENQKLIFDQFKVFISEVYEYTPPRMNLTNKFVRKTITQLRISEDEITRLPEARRRQLVHIGSEKSKAFNDHYELENWLQ